MENIYCAYDTLNPTIDRLTGKVIHNCVAWGTSKCFSCDSRYDGDKIIEYMERNPKEEIKEINKTRAGG